MLTTEKERSTVIQAGRRNLSSSATVRTQERVAQETDRQNVTGELAAMTAADFVALIMGTTGDEHYPREKYPPLIQELSGIIRKTDLDRMSREDERIRYILRDAR